MVNSSTKPSWQLVTSSVPSGPIPRPVMFNILDLNDGMECTSAKFTDNSQIVRETADRPEGRVAGQNMPSDTREKN